MEHILHECDHHEAVKIRKKAREDAQKKWEKAYKGDQGITEWKEFDPTNRDQKDWEQWWGWLGLMPDDGSRGQTDRREAAEAASKIMAMAGHSGTGRRPNTDPPDPGRAKSGTRGGTTRQ